MRRRFTCAGLINARKKRWNETHDLKQDKLLIEAIANQLLSDIELLKEVRKNPEHLVQMCFYVVDKDKQTVPFFFNEVQQEFIDILNKAIQDFKEGKITTISLLILKSRQQGFTTFISAYQLACFLTGKNFEGFTLADAASNAEAIFDNKAKLMFNLLPDCLKPTMKYDSKRQYRSERMNSSWAVDVATKEVGRSRTINFLHGSEVAFWKDGVSNIQAGLGQAMTKDAIKIYETTANGFNDFKTMWDSGEHINCFFEWWKSSEYRMKFESKTAEEEFMQILQQHGHWIYDRLRWLLDEVGLEMSQAYWYYRTYKGFIEEDKIKQEYPCSPDEAFLMSGNSVFNTEIVFQRKQFLLKNPPKYRRGIFVYDYVGQMIVDDSIRFVEDDKGPIKIFREPIKVETDEEITMRPYVIGGDTAGEGSDFFVGRCIDNTNGVLAAKLRDDHIDSDLYAKQLYCLGRYYNDAMIAIEANYDSHPIKELERLGYQNQFVREDEETYQQKVQKKFGFITNKLTRPMIISNLITYVREHIELFDDIEFLNECLTFIKTEKGRAEAAVGEHDDEVMCAAITFHCRKQQRYVDIVKQKRNKRRSREEMKFFYG